MVHGNQVHHVHQEDPDKQGQRQRRDQRILAAEGAAHAVVDKLDDPFNEVLPAGRGIGAGPFGGHAEQPQEQYAQADREQHAVDVDRPETHRGGILPVVGKTPVTGMRVAFRKLAPGQVGQVVLYIFRSCQRIRRHGVQTSFLSR